MVEQRLDTLSPNRRPSNAQAGVDLRMGVSRTTTAAVRTGGTTWRRDGRLVEGALAEHQGRAKRQRHAREAAARGINRCT
jgi:hypothetical protein